MVYEIQLYFEIFNTSIWKNVDRIPKMRIAIRNEGWYEVSITKVVVPNLHFMCKNTDVTRSNEI